MSGMQKKRLINIPFLVLALVLPTINNQKKFIIAFTLGIALLMTTAFASADVTQQYENFETDWIPLDSYDYLNLARYRHTYGTSWFLTSWQTISSNDLSKLSARDGNRISVTGITGQDPYWGHRHNSIYFEFQVSKSKVAHELGINPDGIYKYEFDTRGIYQGSLTYELDWDQNEVCFHVGSGSSQTWSVYVSNHYIRVTHSTSSQDFELVQNNPGSTSTLWMHSGIESCNTISNRSGQIDFVALKVYYNIPTPNPSWDGASAPLNASTHSTLPQFNFICPTNGLCYIQISTNIGFTNIVHETSQQNKVTEGTYEYTNYTLPSDGDYYIRIRNDGNATTKGIGTSSVRKITYTTTQSFEITSPGAMEQYIDTPYMIEWETPSGGIPPYNYKLQIADTSNFANIIKEVSNLTSPFYSVSNLEEDETYYIKVVASDTNEITATSPTRTVTVSNIKKPTIISPTQGQTLGPNFTFEWLAPTGGIPPYTYEVAIGENTFSTSETQYALQNMPKQTYSLKVRAKDSTLVGGYPAPKISGWANVSVTVDYPDTPNITFPSHGQILGSPINITWEPTLGGNPPLTYKVETCQGTHCETVHETYSTTSTELVTSILTEGYWTLRLFAEDSQGVESNKHTLIVNVRNLTVPKIVSPIQGGTQKDNELIKWEKSTGGSEDYLYQLQISDTETFTPSRRIIMDKTVENVLSTDLIPISWVEGKTYYLRMRTIDNAHGSETDWTTPREFRITKPTTKNIQIPKIATPSELGMVTSESPTIIWESLGQNLQYKVQVSSDLLFSNVLYENTTSQNTMRIPKTYLPEVGTYYVRVQTIQNNLTSDWSETREIFYQKLGEEEITTCDPPCETGEQCIKGVCIKTPSEEINIRGKLIDFPTRMEPGKSYFIRTNLSAERATTETLSIKIYSTKGILYESTIQANITQEGINRGVTIDIPENLTLERGTYTIEIKDSKGIIVASAQTEWGKDTSIFRDILEGNILGGLGLGESRTVMIIIGCVAIGALSVTAYLKMNAKPTKTKAKPKKTNKKKVKKK